MASPGFLIAAAARPHPTEVVSGDIWHVDWLATGCRIAVIDGLGHGPDAAFAAQQAGDTLALSPNLGPADALRVCHQALSGTRGAAIGIALIETSMGTLTYAGVGNVEARVVTPEKVSLLASSRGIVGSILPTIRPTEISL